MTILPLVSINNPVLHKKAKQVSSIDDSIQKLIDDMIETMHRVGGVGLAAPQIGVSLQVAVIEMPEAEVITIINPEIIKQSSEYEVTEGCLSMPKYRGEIKRSFRVTVKARNRRGKTIRIKAEDLLAQALQHEIDHLNGIVYVDRMESKDKLHEITAEEV
ncbi:peptide deformylase [Chloroflexota bacterium]